MGLETLREFPRPYAPHGKFAPFAARFEVPIDTLRKARAFARAFSHEELEILLNPAGQPVPWACVRLLVSVKSRRERMSLVREILRNGWTARQLGAEIVRRKPGGASRRGRRRKIVTASKPEQKRMLIAAAREFLAVAAPNEFERNRLTAWSGKDFDGLFEAVVTHSRETMARFRPLRQ